MSAPMSEQRLAEILARAEAATPGPWCADEWEIYQGTEYVPGVSAWIGETCRGTSTPEQDRADASFVAAARTDVPELAAAVQLLAAEVAGLRARITELEALTPAPIQTCRTCGTGYDYGKPCSVCEFKKRMAAALAEDPHDSPLASTLVSPWQQAVAGLNALVDADVIFHVEPDGHISAPFSDEHIEWDLQARRWVLTHDDEDESAPALVEAPHSAPPVRDLRPGADAARRMLANRDTTGGTDV
ncbi:hypothetical protein [Streptomyces sp. NPDC006971]|uniref:hypothetical protein n=1 Tax=Streptomyces sp. NPDC006971 TaxID=3154784 RepID=UPI0033F683C9